MLKRGLRDSREKKHQLKLKDVSSFLFGFSQEKRKPEQTKSNHFKTLCLLTIS